MSEISISLGEANAWINKVEREMDEAQTILAKTNDCLDKFEKKDDVIYKNLNEINNTYKSAWNNLKTAYRNVFDGLRSALAMQTQTIEDLKSKIHEEQTKAKS